uniref:MFS domain-containing protein n=1 Tax=Macrostomum lignano TaxID=282301 RepID=A0A1I8IJ33_9PLAT
GPADSADNSPTVGCSGAAEWRAAAGSASVRAGVADVRQPCQHRPDRRRRVISGGGGGGGGVGSSYTGSLKRLASNPGFVLLTVSYGLNTGTYYALSTLLNPIIVPEMRKADVNATLTTDIEQQVGWAGFTMIAAGILGSVLAGIVLGKTKAFKCTTLAIYVLSCLSTVGFAATLPLASMWLVFAAMFLLGLFMTGYLPVGFEFAAEITYPENEGLSSGILNASAQLMGIICTMVVRMVVDRVSTLAGNIIFCCLLVAGSVMTAVIKSDLRRQRANQAAMSGAAPAHTAARRSSNHNREAELLADIENELEADKLA